MTTQGDRMREVRFVFHMNQRQLAKRIGVTSQLISQVESGKLAVSHMVAKAIEAELGVNYRWLMDGEGTMVAEKANPVKIPELCPELVTALGYYPAVADVLNRIAKKMTLVDWEALNELLTRE